MAVWIVISLYRMAISGVVHWCVIAVIVPLTFHFAFMICTCAGAFCWNCALFTADTISSLIFLGRGMLSSLFRISYLSAILGLDVMARPGSAVSANIIILRCFSWFLGRTFSHCVGGDGFIIVIILGGRVGVRARGTVGPGFGCCCSGHGSACRCCCSSRSCFCSCVFYLHALICAGRFHPLFLVLTHLLLLRPESSRS